MIKIVRELDRSGYGDSFIRRGSPTACLVTDGTQFWVVSSAYTMDRGDETLVFRANEEGEITNWLDVAGYPGASREDAIKDLEDSLR